MMRKILLIMLLFLSISMPCFAEKHYVFINNLDRKVDKGQEAGQTTKGDIVAITPYTSQYRPTKAEKNRYKIIVMDLTDEEISKMLEPETKDITHLVDGKIEEEKLVIKARKRKIDLTRLKTLKQEEIISDKTKILPKITVKSLPVYIISK